MYSLESPYRGDSNEYTQYANIIEKIEKTSLNNANLPRWPSVMNNPQLLELHVYNKSIWNLKMFELLRFDYTL